MTTGPGKYDDVATVARHSAAARGLILVVFDGAKGSGFSVQATADVLAEMPLILRRLADDIEADIR